MAALLAGNGIADTPPDAVQHDCPYMNGMHGPACGDAQDCPAGHAGMGMGPGHGGAPWLSRLEALNLTAEQRAAMKQTVERYRTRGMDLAQRGAGIRDELVNVTPDDPTYAAITDKAAESAAAIAADAVRLLSEMRGEVNVILTETQRQQLKEQMSAERRRWDDWRTRHRPAE